VVREQTLAVVREKHPCSVQGKTLADGKMLLFIKGENRCNGQREKSLQVLERENECSGQKEKPLQ
jgi:hypothetical protein